MPQIFHLPPQATTIGLKKALKISWIHFFFLLCQCYTAARPVILEPVMLVEVKVPTEFQGTVGGDINKWVVYCFYLRNPGSLPFFLLFWKHFSLYYGRRKGVIVGNDQDGDDSIITANVRNFSFMFVHGFMTISSLIGIIRLLCFFSSFLFEFFFLYVKLFVYLSICGYLRSRE